MKKLFFVFILYFLSTSIYSQLKINGFGKLKLDDPVTIVNQMGYEVIPISTQDEYFSKVYKKYNSTKIYELLPDTIQNYKISSSSLDKRVRVFSIPKYPVTEKIEIKLVTLKFFNNKLIDIFCDLTIELTDALTTKYGEPKIKVEEEDHEFVNSYSGNSVTKTDKTFTSTWETNDLNISCTSLLKHYYNDKGEENFISFVHLYNTSYGEEIRKAEDSINKVIVQKKLLLKKKELDEF